MDIIKAFTDNEQTSEINIKGTFDNPLFQANKIGKLLELSNIHVTLKDFDSDEKVIILTYTPGGEQNLTFLTEYGLYKLLGMSRKPIAKKFNKWICGVIKEIRLTGQYKLEGELQNIRNDIKTNRLKFELKQHKTFLEKCNKISGVYFAKIKEVDDDNIIIKIGSTEDIVTRTEKLQNDFGCFIVLDFFEASEILSYETSLHKDPFINQFKYNEPINGIKSKELFLINNNDYNSLVNIAINKQNYYKNINEEKYLKILEEKKEIEKIQLEKINKELELKNNNSELYLKNAIIEELKNISIVETKKIIIKTEVPYKQDINIDRNVNRGFKIQKYTIDGKLLCTYKSNMDTIRNEPNTSVAGLKKAINDKMIYKKHRWMFLDRDKNDDTHQDIGETKQGAIQNNGLIAMLDINKKIIVKVYPDQLSASKERQLSHGGMCSAIKRGSLSSGHYFMYYDECSDELKEDYLSKYELPEKTVRKNAKVIKQIHPITNELIKEHGSMAQIQKEFQVSLISLKKAINEDKVLKNFKWKI